MNSQPKNTTYISGNNTDVPFVYNIQGSDDIINVNTTNGPVDLYLMNINNSQLMLYPKLININDTGNNAGTYAIRLYPSGSDTISDTPSGQTFISLNRNGINALLSVANKDEWNCLDLGLKLPISPQQKTGTVLAFDTDRIYGTTSTPETGNITADLEAARIGVSAMLIHNNGSAPTFGAEFVMLSGSGTYTTGVLNYIYCQYIDATHILYTISQAA